MKKGLTLAASLLLALGANAQTRTAVPASHQAAASAQTLITAQKPSGGAASGVILPGTLADTSCGITIYYAGTSGSDGYLAGNNKYGDKEKLMRYSLSNYGLSMPASVDTVYAFFGLKYVGADGNVRAKVYADNGSGAPGALLGTSISKTVSMVDTNAYTRFGFTSPVNLTTDKFFVAIDFSDLYSGGDTVALLSSDDCAAVDTMAAWDKFSDNSFVRTGDANNWGTDLEFLIGARITATSGVATLTPGAFETRAFPNPASGQLNVSFHARAGATTKVALKDLTGKLVASQSVVATGSDRIALDVSALGAGMYFCEIQSEGIREVLKVSVQ